MEAPGFRILSPEEQLERERVQAEQRPSGQFAADMEERMAVLKAAGVTSALCEKKAPFASWIVRISRD